MIVPRLRRRRAIALSAAASGLALLPIGAGEGRAQWHDVTWHGKVFGAPATIRIHHHSQEAARGTLEKCVREIDRLERIFSLYRADSAVVELNRRGAVAAPAPELVELLLRCRHYAALTGGAFDPSVQPLWLLYAGHFSRASAEPAGPSERAISAAAATVGFHHVAVSPDRIAFARRGMGLTLNGIVQGYCTDRVVDLLRAEGIEHSLVDLGEERAIGAHPDGRAWAVGIADPDAPAKAEITLPLVDQAVATSGGYGFQFDSAGRFNHLFDPRSGLSARRYRSVTVVMPDATTADALSTAFNFMPADAIEAVLKKIGTGRAWLIGADGAKTVLHA